MQAIIQYLRRKGYACVDGSWYSHIKLWQQWYAGKVRSIHSYRYFNGKKKVPATRKSMGMAKSISEDWANLLLNEKVTLEFEDEQIESKIIDILDRNRFWVQANQLIELSFALGTGAFVAYRDRDQTKIDYIRAGMIYPLEWEHKEITQCAFASERTVKHEKHVYLNIHRLEHGKYVIENHMFRRDGSNLSEIDLPEGVEPIHYTHSEIPYFQIVKPNIANNLDLNSPMGVSVYANALDQLEGVDLIYDSYCNEFKLGKKRITVPMTMAQIEQEADGVSTPVFDDNDLVFYAVPAAQGGDSGEEKIVEHNMELRAEAHETGIQTALNLLSYKCGLGKERYDFQSGQLKTATEVISSKSDLFQNLRKHEILLNDALLGLVRAVVQLEGMSPELRVKVNFDDSIIEDTNAEKMRFMQEINAGIRQKWEYRAAFLGEDETRAKAMVQADEGLSFNA